MQFRQLLMNNCNCQRDCLLPHLTQASKQVAMILILRFLRILRFVLSAFCSEMCLHSCVQPECRGLKGASKHFSERLHPTPVVSPPVYLPYVTSPVFTASVGRIYRSQGLERTSSVWYSSTTLYSHNQTQSYK